MMGCKELSGRNRSHVTYETDISLLDFFIIFAISFEVCAIFVT